MSLSAWDWDAITAELDASGCAVTPRLLTPVQCRDLARLYDQPDLFRSTIDMARHRFGSGQYRYFTHDLPEPVRALREACYPYLLTTAPHASPVVATVPALSAAETRAAEALLDRLWARGASVRAAEPIWDVRRPRRQSRARGPILLNSRGARMDRHAAIRRLASPRPTARGDALHCRIEGGRRLSRSRSPAQCEIS